MPAWDEPTPLQRLDQILRDLAAAEALCSALPPASRDRTMVASTIGHLEAQLRAALDDFQAAEREGSMTFEQQLRLASDTLIKALDQMRDLEEEKRREPAGSKRYLELARTVDDLALQILRHTEYQESTAETLNERREAGGGTGPALDAIKPEPRDLHLILDDWRDAERRLVAAAISSGEAAQAAADIRRLREEYRISRGEIGDPPR